MYNDLLNYLLDYNIILMYHIQCDLLSPMAILNEQVILYIVLKRGW